MIKGSLIKDTARVDDNAENKFSYEIIVLIHFIYFGFIDPTCSMRNGQNLIEIKKWGKKICRKYLL